MTTKLTRASATVSLLRGLVALSLTAQATAAGADPRAGTVWVGADGAIRLSTAAPTAVGREPPATAREFSFGLPDTAPVRRELEGGGLPIARTQWERGGIRYTQIVLLTRLGPEGLLTSGGLADDSVLLVQLTGENTTNEYAEATAALLERVGGEPRELELREDRVHVADPPDSPPVAVVAVPATGIHTTRGSALRFRGSMPPGTSGSMTFKIPLRPLSGEAASTRLRELEFDEEFRRVKRFWAERTNDIPAGARPMALQEVCSGR